jgi:uncharacterized protein (DUF2062 family)
MFFPLLDHKITCSHLRDHFLALVLDFSLLEVWRNLLEELFLCKVVLYAIGRFTTRVGLVFLHDLVSVLHQSFLIE